MIITDSQLDKSFVYFLCAYYFKWTPKQVDETEAYLLEELLTMLPLWRQKQQEGLNND